MDSSTEKMHEQCLLEHASVLRDACRATHETKTDVPIWGALAKLSKTCMEQDTDTTANATDAHGLWWAVGAFTAFKEFLPRFNNMTGLSIGYKGRTIAEYILNWVEVWPTPGTPGPNDYWMLGAEVFGEDIKHKAFVDLTRVLTFDPSYRLSEIPAHFRRALPAWGARAWLKAR
ncbi:hypothetical protein GPECTOR_41g655 [Gonium pectorale]|uniref:Uncharacterized protein n=1 Tax=Gonium pectorale TaxID=33097 RepID=A0A150GA25_GONPE|nr:hypothetical protein GPECTOR_41g655 [Gonium pectorale]|eukprot:KXZ46691.1 hypothetical protein GPECTOR_41g655 [Gonium pectorale]